MIPKIRKLLESLLILPARPRWSEMFPDGRTIFYEGDDPHGFARTIRQEYGFDPSLDDGWGVPLDVDGRRHIMFQFFCPPEHLDAIYGSSRFPLGS
jgi:hypothetical protein